MPLGMGALKQLEFQRLVRPLRNAGLFLAPLRIRQGQCNDGLRQRTAQVRRQFVERPLPVGAQLDSIAHAVELAHPEERISHSLAHQHLHLRDHLLGRLRQDLELAFLAIDAGAGACRLQPHQRGLPMLLGCCLVPQLHGLRPVALVGPEIASRQCHRLFMHFFSLQCQRRRAGGLIATGESTRIAVGIEGLQIDVARQHALLAQQSKIGL